jgi:hypothetical protein
MQPSTRSLVATLAATVLLVTLPAVAQAQKTKPGLWEHSTHMKSGSGRMEAGMAQMQEQMAKMSPEQRQMMEKMMADRGIGMAPGGLGGGGGTSVRVCVSPAQAERDEMPQAGERCKQTSMQRKGNEVKVSFTCEGNPPVKGEGVYTFKGGGAYNGQMSIDTVVNGKPERIESTMSGRWLGADCGAVKPVSER